MKYVGICCATYQQKNYLCHWCPTVVSGSRRRLLPSRCPGFLLLLFGNSPATRAIIGVKFAQSISPSYLNLLHPAEREQTVGLENRSTAISSAGLVFMSWKLVSMRDDFVWNCGGGGCYHTEEKSRMKRRRGCRGWRGSPILASRAQKSPKNHSPTLKSSEEWHIGWWLGRRGRSQLRRVTDSRAEEEGAAPAGKEDHPASDTSPASH